MNINNFENHLYESRAVAVVSRGELPQPFLDALIYGSVRTDDKKYDARDIIRAVTWGFIKPKPEHEEENKSSLCAYFNSKKKNYVIANHLQASCYRDRVRNCGTFTEKPFQSAADVLLEIIPSIRLHRLICPILNSDTQPFLSKEEDVPVPHEHCWNSCFINLFQRNSGSMHCSEKRLGMPDFACTYKSVKIIIESIMSYRSCKDIQEHADRFGNSRAGMKQYQVVDGCKYLRGLVIIGGSMQNIKEKMADVKLDEGNKDLQIMGLCPYSGYHSMEFILRTPSNDLKNYTISCNMVPQRLRKGELVVGHTFGKSFECRR